MSKQIKKKSAVNNFTNKEWYSRRERMTAKEWIIDGLGKGYAADYAARQAVTAIGKGPMRQRRTADYMAMTSMVEPTLIATQDEATLPTASILPPKMPYYKKRHQELTTTQEQVYTLEETILREAKKHIDFKRILHDMTNTIQSHRLEYLELWPTVQDFQARLPKAACWPLGQLVILPTRQREIKLPYITNIVRPEIFNPQQIMGICIRPVAATLVRNSHPVTINGVTYCLSNVWDGQHTVLMLYTILTQVYGLEGRELAEFLVPCCAVYEGVESPKEERRMTSAMNSSEGKRPWELADHFDMGVQNVATLLAQGIDPSLGTSEAERRDYDSHLKQQLLHKHHSFLSGPGRPDRVLPGALTRIVELDTCEARDPQMHQILSAWLDCLKRLHRGIDPIDPNASEVMMLFFTLAVNQQIDLTQWVEPMYKILARHYRADFKAASTDPDGFWNQYAAAYRISHTKHEAMRKKSCRRDGVTFVPVQVHARRNKRNGVIFLLAILRAYLPAMPLPVHHFDTYFEPIVTPKGVV